MPQNFEKQAQEFFLDKEGLQLDRPFPLQIGFGGRRKAHRYDLGSEEPKVIVECKKHTWTESGNAPSAKMSVWNEAMLYFTLAPDTYRKIFFVLKSIRNGRSLGDYYLKTYGHLIPPGVEIWEYDPDASGGELIFPVAEAKKPIQPKFSSKSSHQNVGNATVEDFRSALRALFGEATKAGENCIRVKAGDLHLSVVGSRSTPNRMPTCCDAMYSLMGEEDDLIYAPPKGKGANLEIEYKLSK